MHLLSLTDWFASKLFEPPVERNSAGTDQRRPRNGPTANGRAHVNEHCAGDTTDNIILCGTSDNTVPLGTSNISVLHGTGDTSDKSVSHGTSDTASLHGTSDEPPHGALATNLPYGTSATNLHYRAPATNLPFAHPSAPINPTYLATYQEDVRIQGEELRFQKAFAERYQTFKAAMSDFTGDRATRSTNTISDTATGSGTTNTAAEPNRPVSDSATRPKANSSASGSGAIGNGSVGT
ncbi:hypothetical protein CC86DRAFT_472203 [Ophiobolus disseminans]|uniref:Uncharacterized protein n=1 Tax=Ophiobolus disseminans TaxID=1469910 RepID=A0A6A6ZEH2_9PLEO|nr:hypothetical protein CC86DRAFT_472203 [Ophiobolus disseminans]